MQQQSEEFSFNRSGTTGCEIRGPDGLVVAWSMNEVWASVLVHLLNNGPIFAVDVGAGLPEAACCCGGVDNRAENKL